ncbi:hypothetical protein GGI25_001153 [Coemansia spiralis]|uniref:6-pyruvoyltetrahydropterin synthase n=2 Tax=Coemansia TaxID=4863 RepID=A0A9W8KZV1_9FUNG|nr:putative pyruvoyl tetrahydrobiopterin synthase [Coemansia spiralis]KAJ1995586.1 hypothetical protein EDC05_000824 [Coemansia umbellata]KAJ2625082.1 hypothetical protein GGI26_000885 [Coemansia sp. RSA 1358]KAJ2679964.1 hypothetical protein GGI25_001153 [Coemansia spiralis]
MSPICYLSRVAHFSAAHRLHNPSLSAETNRQVFGKCNHPGGHGHNYIIEVVVRGPVNSETGMLISIDDLKQWIKSAVLDIMDHRNIDQDIAYFKARPSTAENIAVFSWIRLSQVMPPGLLHQVIVSETIKNKASFSGEGLTDKDIEACIV